MESKCRRRRKKGLKSRIVANTNVVVVPRTKRGLTTNDGRVVVDDMTDCRRILLIRIHPPPLFPTGVVTVVNAIKIVDMSIIQTRVVTLIDGNTGQGRSRAIAIRDMDRQVYGIRKRTHHHEGRSIAIDIGLGQDQGLVDHLQRIISNSSCLR